MWRAFLVTLLLLPVLLLLKVADISERKFLATLTPEERDKYLWRMR